MSARLFRIVLQVGAGGPAFYAGLLGEPGRAVGGGRHYFQCGDVILALLQPPSPTAAPDYVYFAVDDLEAFHARAREAGALSSEEIHGSPAGDIVKRPWGERSFYAVDPDGNRLCFVDAKTLFTGRR